ncbi:MAG: 50S ribosomal protein L11 methyltransferase [Hyphomicrobiaceae bacterium]
MTNPHHDQSPAPGQLMRLSLVVGNSTTARHIAEHLTDDDSQPALATSLFEEDGGRQWRIDAYYAEPLAATVLMAAVAGHDIRSGPVLEPVPDENWVAVSQAALPPVSAGRFLIHGSHDRVKVGRRQWALQIDAGEAFGTAHHATTEGCLETLDRLARISQPSRILDLGCGSGVLAIAATRLWPHATVCASDIDPVAIDVARANAALNRAADRIRMVTAIGLDHAVLRRQAPYDLIVANILAGPLIRMAPSISASTRPGGVVILSGILTPQAREVLATYRSAGFRCRLRRTISGWTTLLLQRDTKPAIIRT